MSAASFIHLVRIVAPARRRRSCHSGPHRIDLLGVLESSPFRVLTAAAGVPAGTEKRLAPRLIDYLRCTYNHRRLVCSHPAPGMDRCLYGVGSADCRLLNASLKIFHCC